VATEGPADAGGFYFVDSESLRITEFARRAPWIDAKHTHPTLSFTYTAADGARLSGLVTVPNLPHLKPIPMVLLCPTAPWERVSSNFSTEVQALTDMGFAVVQLNGRGAWGLGTKQREAITAGYDLVQVEDIASSIAHLEKFFNINPKRVALLGFGHGGFIALRTVQDHPDKFRCAIALDAPVNLANWLGLQEWDNANPQTTLMKAWYGDAARLKANPLASHPEAIRRPVLLLNYPGREGQQRTPTFLAALRLAKAVENSGAPAQFGQLSTDYMRGLPGARAAVFGQIEEFLNLNVYDFKVKMPEMKMVQN
jgi:dipeptidyl aminopeptidase/acylaminoacyl peptidase